MGKGIKMVEEAEKGRERERVEKWRPAMTSWKGEGGMGRKGEQEGKRQEREVRVRERERWGMQPLL